MEQENLTCILQVLPSLRYDEMMMDAIFRDGAGMIESPLLNRLTGEREMKGRRSVSAEILTRRFDRVTGDISAEVQTVSSLEKLADLKVASCSAPPFNRAIS